MRPGHRHGRKNPQVNMRVGDAGALERGSGMAAETAASLVNAAPYASGSGAAAGPALLAAEARALAGAGAGAGSAQHAAAARTARVGYVLEDLQADRLSVTELLRRERESGGPGTGGVDAQIAQGIARHSRFKEDTLFGGAASGRDEDDEGSLDDIARIAAGANAEARFTAAERQRRDMQRAVQVHQRAERALEGCRFCFDNPSIKKHCIISLGEHCMLMLPPDGPLLPGHMVLTPLAHVPSVRETDEGVYAEINAAKARLHAMYAARGEDVVFLETVLPSRSAAGGIGGVRRHTRIDVIPMDAEVALDVPLYFKKALQDADQWAAANRAVIDTAGKGLRRSIPVGFPYFHVSWQGGGYVHVIDEEDADFPPDFGASVCAGMMGIASLGEYRSSLRESSGGGGGRGRGGADARGGRGRQGAGGSSAGRRPLSFEEEKAAVLEFLKGWEPYDWTAELEGGEAAPAPAAASSAAPASAPTHGRGTRASSSAAAQAASGGYQVAKGGPIPAGEFGCDVDSGGAVQRARALVHPR
jgi:hypothetical protein